MKIKIKNDNKIIYKSIIFDIENENNIKLTYWQKFFISELLENRFVSLPRGCGTSMILKNAAEYLENSFVELDSYFKNRRNKFHHYVSILEIIKEVYIVDVNGLIENKIGKDIFEQEFNMDYNTFLKLVGKYKYDK